MISEIISKAASTRVIWIERKIDLLKFNRCCLLVGKL